MEITQRCVIGFQHNAYTIAKALVELLGAILINHCTLKLFSDRFLLWLYKQASGANRRMRDPKLGGADLETQSVLAVTLQPDVAECKVLPRLRKNRTRMRNLFEQAALPS